MQQLICTLIIRINSKGGNHCNALINQQEICDRNIIFVLIIAAAVNKNTYFRKGLIRETEH